MLLHDALRHMARCDNPICNGIVYDCEGDLFVIDSETSDGNVLRADGRLVGGFGVYP